MCACANICEPKCRPTYDTSPYIASELPFTLLLKVNRSTSIINSAIDHILLHHSTWDPTSCFLPWSLCGVWYPLHKVSNYHCHLKIRGLLMWIQGLVHNYSGLLACRFFLGLMEGLVILCIILSIHEWTRWTLSWNCSLSLYFLPSKETANTVYLKSASWYMA